MRVVFWDRTESVADPVRCGDANLDCIPPKYSTIILPDAPTKVYEVVDVTWLVQYSRAGDNDTTVVAITVMEKMK